MARCQPRRSAAYVFRSHRRARRWRSRGGAKQAGVGVGAGIDELAAGRADAAPAAALDGAEPGSGRRIEPAQTQVIPGAYRERTP